MHETVYLSDPSSPLRIEYSCAAMEEIRERARDGLIAVPRIAVGVGGLLVGTADQNRVRVLDSIEIPCSHSAGPSFTLTAEERRQCEDMIAEAAADGGGRVRVIGWYCSKTRGDGGLSEEDLTFHRELFAGPSQIVMVVRPTAQEPMHAAFFSRDSSGSLVKRMECVVNAWRPSESSETPAAAGGTVTEPAAPVPPVDPAPVPAKNVTEPPLAQATPVLDTQTIATTPIPLNASPLPLETRLSDIVEALAQEKSAPAAPKPATSSAFFGSPQMEQMAPRRRNTKLLIGAAIAVGLAVIGVTAVLTESSWMPKPPLTLTSSELNGSLVIHWNANAVTGVDHGSLFVNDGGVLETLPLDRFQLNSGLLTYTPKSKRVSAKLDAGGATAITTWFAEPPPAPAAQAPSPGGQTPGASPAPTPAVVPVSSAGTPPVSSVPLVKESPAVAPLTPNAPAIQTHPAVEDSAKPRP